MRRRAARTIAGLVATVLAATILGPALLAPAAGAVGTTPAGALTVGMLQATPAYYRIERASGFRAVVVSAEWMLAEPTPGRFSPGYLASLAGSVRRARRWGFEVTLDTGVQYAPQWVFSLPGGTRFVDQYGDAFTGSAGSGDRVANAVTDMAVRAAMGRYLAVLGRALPRGTLAGVRVGGGPYNELRYPTESYAGHDDCWWAYDPSSQAGSPVPGWRPGTGTRAQARAFLDHYDAELAGYGAWQDAAATADFHAPVVMLFPGWGERPAALPGVESSLLTQAPDEYHQGLDWGLDLAVLPDRRTTMAYTTYLDAPSFPANPDPAAFLASLARRYHMALGGENTGDGSQATLALVVSRARTLGYSAVNWMEQSQVVASSSSPSPGGQPTWASFRAELRG